MIPGLQTHIEGWTDPEELRFVRAQGFQMARISAMDCSKAVLAQMVADTVEAGLVPFVTVSNQDRFSVINLRDAEWRNEDDGDLSPKEYRRLLEEACAAAIEWGVRLWAPTCSNTNRKCVQWAKEVRGSGWPIGMHGLSWHSYDPHENTEFAAVKALADGKPIIFSEFGYPSLGVSEEVQAAKIRDLWTFYAEFGAYAAILFQIHDGPNPREREHCYGIRRFQGDWKPSAYTVPKETIGPALGDDMNATFALSRKNKIPDPDKPNFFTAKAFKDGVEGVTSVQPDGSIGWQKKGSHGAYEEWYEDGNKAIFPDVAGQVFAVPLVD